MKKIALVCSTVLSTAISSLLLSAPALAGSGFYAELSAGSVKHKAEVNSVTYNGTYMGESFTEIEAEKESLLNESGTSFGIRFGYQFNDYIAVELGHHQYGEADEKYVDKYGDNIHNKLKSSATSVGIKGILPLSDDFSLFARAGIAKWDMKLTVSDSSAPDETYVLKDDNNDLYYGLGAEYNFSETVSLGLEYTMLDMDWNLYRSESSQDFNYSKHVKGNYQLSNLALILKVNF